MKKVFVLIMAMLMVLSMVACTNESDDKQMAADECVTEESVGTDNVDLGDAENSDEEFLGGYGGPGEDYVASDEEYVDPTENEEAY